MIPGSRIVMLPLAAVTVTAPAYAMVYLSLEQAQQLMFAGRTLEPLPLTLSAEDIGAIEKDSGVKVYPGVLRAWKARIYTSPSMPRTMPHRSSGRNIPLTPGTGNTWSRWAR